jgi:HTH-type transcriptional regulator/antitoxin HipB
MTTDYPVRFAAQLRQHLKAFRKARKLTQAQLGKLIGVSQARIAEIEANPGLVSFEQLMQLLSVLEVTISLSEDLSKDHTARPKKGTW